MRLPSLIVTAALLMLLGAPDARAALYRWTDDTGRENFTNDLSLVPERYRDSSTVLDASPDRTVEGDSPAPAVGGKTRQRKKDRDLQGRDEQYWRRQAQQLRTRLRDLEGEYELVLREERELAEQPSNGRSRTRSGSVARKKAKLEQKITQARQRLETDLPDEARKAGALPGWLRE